MTESVSTTETESGGEAPITLRRLRVESEYREVTRGLERRERDKYSSVLWNIVSFNLAPKVHIMDLVGSGMNQSIGERHEGALKKVVDFYHKRSSRADLVQVLKFFSVYLLQRARRESNFGRQNFLLFKAIDLLRGIVHYSNWSVSKDAETVVYAILDDLDTQKPGRFANYANAEHSILRMMKRLQEVPRDFNLRLNLAAEYARQTSFFDALVQYDYLNSSYTRHFRDRNLEFRLGRVYVHIAALFQDMIDFAGRGYSDARKVNSFIERYNREYASRKLTLVPVKDTRRVNVRRTAQSLRQVAEGWYRKALQVGTLRSMERTATAHALSRNLVEEGRTKEANAILNDNYRHFAAVGTSREGLEAQVDFLELLIHTANLLRRREQAGWAAGEQREARATLETMVRESSDYEKRMDAVRRDARPVFDDDEPGDEDLV